MARATCPMCRQPHHRLGGAPVLASLAAGPRRIARAAARARGRRLRRRPQPREWSVVEILAHLLDGEVTLGFRIRKIAAEPGGTLDTLALVRRLTPAQRRATARHPEYGPLGIDQLLHHWAEHDLIHREQIQSTLRTLAQR